MEGRFADDCASNVHECVQEIGKHGRALVQGDNEGGAAELFVCQIEECYDAKTEVRRSGDKGNRRKGLKRIGWCGVVNVCEGPRGKGRRRDKNKCNEVYTYLSRKFTCSAFFPST